MLTPMILMLNLMHGMDFSCSVRSVVALNLESYGSGSHPWGNLKPDYLEKVFFLLMFLFHHIIVTQISNINLFVFFAIERICGGSL